MTTHSNHLLDMAADYSGCSTLLFRKLTSAKPSFEIRTMSQAERLALDELGVRASSVFLTNSTIWVEGVSDRLYFREYLRKYLEGRELQSKFREDTHYSFMEGGGANIAHFDFTGEITGKSAVYELTEKIRIAKVCSKSFVVLDGDNRGKPRMKDLELALGEDLFVLESKEIENLLPVEVLKAYLRLRGEIKDVELLKLEDYHQKSWSLGKVLDEKFHTDRFTDGQTIKNKDGLCAFCVEFMRDNPKEWKLTPEAETLCQRLVAFIEKANNPPAGN